MKINFHGIRLVLLFGAMSYGCQDGDNLGVSSSDLTATQLDVAQTSAQLASGTSIQIQGSSSDSSGVTSRHGGGHHAHHKRPAESLDGFGLLPPSDTLLAIAEAEAAGDFRGLHIGKKGGATVTHYDESGAVVTLPEPAGHKGPHGCSASNGQFPESDSLLSTIVKTVIDFGTGTTYSRDSIVITRSGKITITRSGTVENLTEVTTFDNYQVNGISIAGTKTRVSTFDATTGNGTSESTVTGGLITFVDGTQAVWTSDRSRTSNLVLDTNGKPTSGTITTTADTEITTTAGTLIYSHKSTTPLVEDITCRGRRRGPVSGVLETQYLTNNLIIDFGQGSCSSQTITITLNGVTTTETIGD